VSAARTRLGAESGLSLIEVLVAALVLVVGLLGVFTTVIGGNRAVTAGVRSTAMAQIAQQTLHAVESLPYANIADSSTPARTTTTDTTNPTYYLSSCSAGTCYQWDPSTASTAEQVAVDTTYGKAAPGPTNVVVPSPTGAACTTTSTAGCQMTFAVYIFVTNSVDSVCSQTGVTCAAAVSYKRVTVAVDNTAGGAPLNPVYVSTFVSNKSGGTGNPLTAGTTTCLDGTTSVPCSH
jgi:Tfp pilus assembly protein PilV